MSKLLDANVLLAFAWASHPHHAAAERWFRSGGGEDWATYLLTQSAFVRLSMNPQVVHVSPNIETILEALSQLVAHPSHRYLSDSPSLVDSSFGSLAGKLVGHRQVTDATLLHTADHHGASLVTFDAGIRSLVSDANGLEIIPVD